jgi:hypothetical protein
MTPDTTNAPTLQRVHDVACEWGVCDRTVWRLIAKGELQTVKVGAATRITTKSKEAFLTKATRTTKGG